MVLELGLVVHGHHGCYDRLRYENTLAPCPQVEELTVLEGQLGISELVTCRRASNGNLVNVPGRWVFSICHRRHCYQSEVFALKMSLYSTVCAFKAWGVWGIGANLG